MDVKQNSGENDMMMMMPNQGEKEVEIMISSTAPLEKLVLCQLFDGKNGNILSIYCAFSYPVAVDIIQKNFLKLVHPN